jgi:hypothetical protein
MKTGVTGATNIATFLAVESVKRKVDFTIEEIITNWLESH